MIQSLQSLTLYVPDLQVGADFYSCMGLIACHEHQAYVFRCEGRDQDQLRLIQGPKKEIAWITWGTTAMGYQQIVENLKAQKIVFHHSHADLITDSHFEEKPQESLWLHDPDGTLLHIVVADSAEQTRAAVRLNHPGEAFHRIGSRGAPDRKVDSRPRKLGHILKFSTDVNQLVEFYTSILGFKLSDRIGDKEVAFMRCSGDSDHHTLALSKSPGLHHCSWEMGNLDQIQLCAQRLIDAGYKDSWGVGRHIYGSNYFHYVRDPWGSLCEFFWDIDFIAEHSDWKVEVASASGESLHENLFQWAATPPPADFLKNFEAVNETH